MPVIQRVPRELLSVEYTTSHTTTSFAADGVAFSPAWGGNFDVAHLTNIEVEIECPYVYNSTTEWVGMVCYVNGANQGLRMFWSWAANVPIAGIHGVWRMVLAAGSHSVSVRSRVQGTVGTGTYSMNATDKGILKVREVG